MRRIGIVDTTFSRYDMGRAAATELKGMGTGFKLIHRTVPGIKDLGVACRALIDEGCDIVLAMGMLGPLPVDRQSAMVADIGLQQVQVASGVPILGVFVYEDEAKDEKELAWLADRRSREHARNAYHLLFRPEVLRRSAGEGLREGFKDAGPLRSAFK
ncbi:MAG: riboflavin synthase [Candidatus Thermoplasmatota archaeon]|nr:riboflavin synthase [Candidatus Thermoplasmatota archaeon]